MRRPAVQRAGSETRFGGRGDGGGGGDGLLAGGCAIACAALALAGQAGTYPLLLALVVVSSLGVAIYHPEATRHANRFAGAHKASGMSLFAVGGNLGFASGPALLGTCLA